jgi:peptidoglycan/LPS O-acetylase OafA/YrhL
MGLSLPFFKHAFATAAQPEPVPLPRGHIPALDGIRGLAILLVTIYRFAGTHEDGSAPRWLLPVLEFGTHGVDLFFVLSGFLITGILFDAKGESHYFRNFYARRTLRIFPLYYGTLALVLVGLPLLGLGTAWLTATGDISSLWWYGSNVMMSASGEWTFGGLNHFWSLCVEEHFYLVWPLVIFACSRTTAMRVCIAAFLASAGGRVLWMLAGGNGVAAEVFTLFRLDALCAGAFIALAARGPDGLTKMIPWARGVLVATGLLLLPLIALRMRLLTVPTTLYACFFAAFIVLAVASAKQGWLSFLGKSKLLLWLGKYSYGMYVYQNLLLVGFASFFTAGTLANLTGSAVIGRIGFILVMSLLTAAIAWVSWHAFEKRWLAWKHYFEGKKPAASTAGTAVTT